MSSSDLHDLLVSGQNPLLLRPPIGSSTGRQGTTGLYQRDPSNESTGGNDGKTSSVSTFQAHLKKWEEQRNGPSYDPTDLLTEMADILEKEHDIYLSKDPDPFEERHPSRVNPECPFGQILKAFFKKEALVEEIFTHYLRDNYWTRLGQSRSSFDLNVASCRIVLDILPGLQKEVLHSTEGLIKRLYGWVRDSDVSEPLQSYATGLLGEAMELQEVATDAENRERNTTLVPLLIQRLRAFKRQAEEERSKKLDTFKRPFKIFSSAGLASSITNSSTGPTITMSSSALGASSQSKHLATCSSSKSPARRSSIEDDAMQCNHYPLPPALRSPDRSINPGWPSGTGYASGPGSPADSSGVNGTGEWSNSSWAEMESHLIGHFPVHPLTLSAKQIFILRLLTPLGEYQEFLTHIFEHRIQDILMGYMNIRETKDARLSFEALRFCSALFCHKKFLLEWVGPNCYGIQLFMEVPRPSICSTGVAQCLYYMANDDDTMEKVCLLPRAVLNNLIRYVLWLVECSHDSGRQWAVMFCGLACSFRVLLDIFDEQEGVRRLYNSISTLQILNLDSDQPGNPILTDDQEYNQRLSVRHVMVTFRLYITAHLAIKAQQLRRLQDRGESTGEVSNRVLLGGNSGSTGMGGVNHRQAIAGSMHQGHGMLTTTPWPAVPAYKPAKFTPAQISERVETLMQLMPFRSRWQPIDTFIQLGGITTCLKTIANAYDWTFQGRSEMVRSALDILSMTAIMPKVQLQFCEKIDLPDDTKPVGINILLGAAGGEIVQDSADVWRSALQVIINCVCAPIDRKGGATNSIASMPSSRPDGGRKSKAHIRTSEELINKIWDCVRENNGIMTLLQLLNIKTPITDADSIRALACRALVGLARSGSAQQIMSKLPIFANNQLQQLIREPILQDKRAEHVKFQSHAYDLLQMVSVQDGQANKRRPILGTDCDDFSLELLHRASVVAQTKIQFSKKQLLQLIQEYLMSQGMHDSASMMSKEGNLAIMTTKQLTHQKSVSLSTLSASLSPSITLMSTPTRSHASTQRTPHKIQTYPTISNTNINNSASNCTSPTPGGGASSILNCSYQSPSSGNHPNERGSVQQGSNTPIRIRKRGHQLEQNMHNLNVPGTSSINSTSHGGSGSSAGGRPSASKCLQKSYEPKLSSDFHELPFDQKENRITLVSIVSDYLSSQHSLCKNPMATCPEFDLFTPHKCPDPRPKNSAPANFVTRLSARMSIFPPYGGPDGGRLDRKLIYSRFRPVKTFRANTEEDNNQDGNFTACALMPDSDYLLAGTYMGDVKMFDINTMQEVSTYSCHDSQINHIQPNNSGSLLLTSSQWRTPYSCLWTMGEFFESKIQFPDDDYVEFSKLSQDKVIGTHSEVASVWDIERGEVIRTLKPQISNNYQKNRATFDPSDDLVLNDGVLFDMRMGKEIRKLDKLNQNLNGVFHPNGLEIVSNSEVWDIRTFHLLKTVPGLDQCHVRFTNSGDIIYAVALEQETDDGENYESAFKTFDATDYSSIATIETRRGVFDLATSINDLQIAVVENSLAPQLSEESVVRLYDVGRHHAEEEDLDDGDDEDEDPDGEDEDDGLDDLGLDDDDSISGSGSGEEDDEDDDENDEDDGEGDGDVNSGTEEASSDGLNDDVDADAELTPGNTSDEEYEPALDDEDQDMEDVAMINFDPAMLRDRDVEVRETGNTERPERVMRSLGGRRQQLSRNAERRRRQQSSSAVITEAAALGGALGRAASGRGSLQSGNRIRQRSRRRRQINDGNMNAPSTEAQATAPNNENTNIGPSTSSESPLGNKNNDENEYKNSENSNSSWEDVSEEEVVGGSGDNSGAQDNTENEVN